MGERDEEQLGEQFPGEERLGGRCFPGILQLSGAEVDEFGAEGEGVGEEVPPPRQGRAQGGQQGEHLR